MNHEYKIKATIDDKKIHITPECGPGGFASALAAKIIDTEDKAIRESLKRLGWMSPEDVASVDVGFEQARQDAYGYKAAASGPAPACVRETSEVLSQARVQHWNSLKEQAPPPPCHDDIRDALQYQARYFQADGIFNRGKSRYSNMSLTELLTEAEAAARQGATGPLYDEVLERLRRVLGTMEQINEPK